ncbi:unnamed protein product [Laminaria digitata]
MDDSVGDQTEHAGAELSNGGGTSSPIDGQLDGSEPVPGAAGGGGDGGRIALAAGAVPPIDRQDHPSMPPPSGALPLWLRPGLQGASILDDICRFMGEFSGRLEERGLSIRPSLDHAWLDQENIAAVTTYTWPRFPQERLRCYVRGAGLSLANGTYSPSELDEGESGASLTLVGPNGCQICQQVRAAVGYDAPAAKSVSPRDFARVKGVAVAGREIEQKVVGEASRVPEESRTAATAPVVPQAPAAQLWCLLVPAESGPDMRSAYYSLGDGALPPSRGWRATDADEMPAPVLGFATHSDGDLDGGGRGGESATLTVGEGETTEALFDPAVPVARDDMDPVTIAAAGLSGADEMASSTPAAIETPLEAETGGGNFVSALSTERSRRRRKRRRSPELAAECAFEEGAADVAAEDRHANGFVKVDCLEAGDVGGSCGDSGGVLGLRSNAPDIETRLDSDRFVGAGTCSTEADLHVDGDEAVAAFKAEKWALPAPSGKLLLRAERTRELLRRTREGRASTLATREEQLLHQLDVAQGEYQEVLRESMAATVERVLSTRSGLRKEAEEEAASEAQLVSASTNRTGQGRSEEEVPSLEELVAEKAEELRNSPQNATDKGGSSPSPGREGDDHKASRGTDMPPIADAGWPWPMDWLSAPRAPPGTAVVQELPVGIIFGGLAGGGADVGSDDGGGADAPPFSIAVEAVEVVDVEGPEAAHVEYVLRVLYREVREARAKPTSTSAASAFSAAAGKYASAHPIPTDDPATTDLLALATAATGLLQRTRVIRKRLNSLCALHPRMMGELLEGRRLRPGGVESAESLNFPDPYELGTLEESILRIHRDKLTPRFKANTPIRKLSSQIEAYLSGLLQFLGGLKAAGDVDVRARMCRALNDALSTCDRFGRKRRRGECVLGVRIEDSTGGRLGSKGGDDARLRTQRRRCMGCKRMIAAEFLGMKKDYFPCRFSDALFCRSLCHSEDRRVIPHRVVHHWDFTPHRVCKDSAAFLDATHFLPVIDLPAESPRLFVAQQQPLRVVRSRRKQLHSLRRAVLFHAEGQCTSGARVFDTSMDGRTHLAVNPDLYSMDDLTGVKTGSLLDFLEEACEALVAHVMDECRTCEARNARVCGICCIGDPVFAFQVRYAVTTSVASLGRRAQRVLARARYPRSYGSMH